MATGNINLSQNFLHGVAIETTFYSIDYFLYKPNNHGVLNSLATLIDFAWGGVPPPLRDLETLKALGL